MICAPLTRCQALGRRAVCQDWIIRDWRGARGRPFGFYTEASVNLANEPQLVDEMLSAGISSVFVGIETPSENALTQARKFQNLRVEVSEAGDRSTRAGPEVLAGFIVGSDTDDDEVFASQREFLADQPIPMAMVGILGALPGTELQHS